jgi:MerR family copper efflux transcriptional regulator
MVMTIGEAANASGMNAKTIRYYERIGLIATAARSGAGYRHYDQADVATLRFIRRARAFGFPIERIRALVSLWQNRKPSREVKHIALEHVAELDRRIAELSDMRDALHRLADACHGDSRPECPILRDLTEGLPGSAVVTRGAGGRVDR